jgi:hypothetical protein
VKPFLLLATHAEDAAADNEYESSPGAWAGQERGHAASGRGGGGGRMEAAVGDRLHVHGNVVGHPERTGEIVEVRGAGGQPPCLVRFDDGHTGLVFPGPDAIIEHPRRKGKKGSAKG